MHNSVNVNVAVVVAIDVIVIHEYDLGIAVVTGGVEFVVEVVVVVGVVVVGVVAVVVAGNLKHVLLTSIFASRLC